MTFKQLELGLILRVGIRPILILGINSCQVLGWYIASKQETEPISKVEWNSYHRRDKQITSWIMRRESVKDIFEKINPKRFGIRGSCE